MTAKPVQELLNSEEATEAAVLLGKGESVDTFREPELWAEPPHAMPWVIGLNEQMVNLPCDWGIYVDKRFEALEVPPDVTVIRPYYHREHHDGRGYIVERKWLQHHSYNFHSSPTLAIHLCAIWGVKRILMVGFDGYDEPRTKAHYGKTVKTLEYVRCTDFTEINRGIAIALRDTRIDAVWWHRGERL